MSIKECRICYENNLEVTKRFISPCACAGTRKYVHSQCLNLWRERKRGHITFIRCPECLYFYNIAKRFRQENASLLLHFPQTFAEILGTFWLTIFIFVVSSAVFVSDPQFTIIEKTMVRSKSCIMFIKKNNEFGFLYYYSFINWLLCTGIYLGIFGYIRLKIRNPLRYFQQSWIIIFSYFLGNFQFFIFRVFLLGDDLIETYLYLTGLFSLFQILEIQAFCHYHNKIIDSLNRNNKDYIKDYDPSHNTQDISEHNFRIGDIEIDIIESEYTDSEDSDESLYMVHPEDSLPILSPR